MPLTSPASLTMRGGVEGKSVTFSFLFVFCCLLSLLVFSSLAKDRRRRTQLFAGLLRAVGR